MVQLIDKDALVTKIERRIKTNKECMLGLRNLDYYQGKVDALNDTISFIDTLEVKEVELTWMDMECIIKNYQDIMAEKSRVFVRVEDYQELLKRFKAQKGEEV